MSRDQGAARAVDAAMALVILSWGVNFSIIKIALVDLPPLVFAAVRYATAGALLIAALGRMEGTRSAGSVRRADLPALIALGLVGHSAYQILFIAGLARTTAGNTALILATSPLFVGLLSAVVGHERPMGRTWLGLVLAFAGLAVLVQGRGGLSLGVDTLAGDLLVLAATLCWAAYTVFSRPLLARISPLRLATLTLLLGLPLLLAGGLPGALAVSWRSVRLTAWGGVAFSAVFAIALSYVFWYRSIQARGGVRTAALVNLIPVVALVTARIMLGEPLGTRQIVGGAIVIGGVWLASAPAPAAVLAVPPEV